MHPAGAVAVAGGEAMKVRAAARASMVLGLAVAAIGIVAATINPGDLYAQSVVHAAQRCAATETDVLKLRGTALLLVLMGVVQTVAAAAADVSVAGSLRVLGRWLAATAYAFAAINGAILCYVVHGATVVAVGHCAGEYLAGLVLYYVLVAVYCLALLGVSLAVTFF